MFNNNSRDRGNLSGLPIRDNYYDNAPTPAQFTENLQDRCLFTRNNNNYKNISQDNTISLESSDSRGIFLHENNYINRPLLDNNINESCELEENWTVSYHVGGYIMGFRWYTSSLSFFFTTNYYSFL